MEYKPIILSSKIDDLHSSIIIQICKKLHFFRSRSHGSEPEPGQDKTGSTTLLNRYPAGFPATSLLTVNTYQYRSCYAQHHLAGLNLFYKLLAESISWGKSVAFHPPLNLSKWSIFLELYSHCVAYVDAMMP